MTSNQFCTQCGTKLKGDANFCTNCSVQQHIVDCAADAPFIRKNWEVKHHDRSLGQIVLDKSKLQLLVVSTQLYSFRKFRKELEGKALNANVMAYLLQHPELIPDADAWVHNDVFFWGTTYCDKTSFSHGPRLPSGYDVWVQFLTHRFGRWERGSKLITCHWDPERARWGTDTEPIHRAAFWAENSSDNP